MSDSDDDSLPNSVFTFQNDNTAISARGPNAINITGPSFRNNVLTSTMLMPVNFKQQWNGGSNFDQRCVYSRRDTSPMSIRSVSGYRPSTLSCSTYQNRMGIRRSIYSGRGGSPMSVRSIDSTASASAADIVFAFNNVKFNKYDLRLIKEAYNRLIKTRQRKRIEKRRNLKLFFKGTRRKSGEDSGEQGSDSSISSDDCRSVRTTVCKENIPGLRQVRDVFHLDINRQRGTNHVTNVPHFTINAKEIPDCTENIKQNTLRNMISNSSNVSNFSTKEKFLNTLSNEQNSYTVKEQNTSVMTQKERFKKGFLLPSQRFNKKVAGQTQVSKDYKESKIPGEHRVDPIEQLMQESDSDQEEIFKGFLVNEKDTQNVQRKRSLDTEDFCYLNNKKNKLNSPNKQSSQPSSINNNVSNGKSNDFIFAKPKMPTKKGKEKLLAKSSVPTIAEEIDFNFAQNNKPLQKENVKNMEDHTLSDMLHSSSNISMRPSFIKRKLFTQKLDVAENKNASCESLGANSPKNIYSASRSERNKARKLVTSQSCLNREVLGEDNNVLDLIHKIVPPDQINVTNLGNRTESCTNKSNDVDNVNKWDVTAVIANCDNQDISDTYTDEEIFHADYDKNSEKSKNKKSIQVPKKECKIVVENLLPQTLSSYIKNINNSEAQIKSAVKETSKKSVSDCVKSFWDTDFESDMEFNVAPSWKSTIRQNQKTVLQKGHNDLGDKQNRNNKNAPNSKGMILSVRNCHKNLLSNNTLKSHRSLISSDQINIESNKPNSVVQEKDNTKINKINKDFNSTSQIGTKKNTINEIVSVNNNKESGRKPKAKQCVDCINDNPKVTSKKEKKSAKLAKHDDNLENMKHDTKKSSKDENLPVNKTLKSKDCKNTERKQANKVTKADQKNNANTQKEPVHNGRTRPKRKSKEKSFVEFSKQSSTTSNTKTPNKIPKTKSAKKFISKNSSIGNNSTIITRSQAKLSFSSSQGDYSSMNLSNTSNRSLRLCQRVQRNRN